MPFSQDMGTSFWAGQRTSYPFRPTPLPLLNGSAADGLSVIEQPTDLSTLVGKYVSFASGFIQRNAKARRPWYLYVPFNHVHAPNSCNPRFCGRSPRGPVGDSVEETDWAVGEIMAAVAASGLASNTITFFTSDKCVQAALHTNTPWLIPLYLLSSAAAAAAAWLHGCTAANENMLHSL